MKKPMKPYLQTSPSVHNWSAKCESPENDVWVNLILRPNDFFCVFFSLNILYVCIVPRIVIFPLTIPILIILKNYQDWWKIFKSNLYWCKIFKSDLYWCIIGSGFRVDGTGKSALVTLSNLEINTW